MTTLREKLGQEARCYAKSSNLIKPSREIRRAFFYGRKVCKIGPLGIYCLVFGWTLAVF